MRRLIVGITGATGTIYGVRLLSALHAAKVETDLIVTRPAEKVMALETDFGSTIQAYVRNRSEDRVIENWGHPRFVAPAFEDGGIVGSAIAAARSGTSARAAS